MKAKKLFMFALSAGLFFMTSLAAGAQIKPEPIPPPKFLYTDLITDGVDYETLGDTQIKVAVRNLGNFNAGKSVLKFVLTKDGKTITKTATVSAVKAKNFVWIPVSPGENLYLSKYCVTADSTNQIKETKENNNTRCGEFGGKP